MSDLTFSLLMIGLFLSFPVGVTLMIQISNWLDKDDELWK